MKEPIHILFVDDNAGDVRLMREVLKDAEVQIDLSVVEDGDEALDFLRRQGRFRDAQRPQLILLDLNLPKKDGREVLAEIKEDPRLGTIPVIVLTTSRDDRDISTSYRLRANCFITKPAELGEFTDMVRSLKDFWLEIATLPSNGSSQHDDDSTLPPSL